MAGAVQERGFQRLSRPEGEERHPRLVWSGRADTNPVEVQRVPDDPTSTVLVVFDMHNKNKPIGHTEVDVPPVIASSPRPEEIKDEDAYVRERTLAVARLKIESFKIIDKPINDLVSRGRGVM